MANKILDYPIWFADFVEVETGKYVTIKVVAKNKNEALKKIGKEIAKHSEIKPMVYKGISCI